LATPILAIIYRNLWKTFFAGKGGSGSLWQIAPLAHIKQNPRLSRGLFKKTCLYNTKGNPKYKGNGDKTGKFLIFGLVALDGICRDHSSQSKAQHELPGEL
jgi:hypothetical protein